MLGGSWVVISGVISRVTIPIIGHITLLITTHEPPSGSDLNRVSVFRVRGSVGGSGLGRWALNLSYSDLGVHKGPKGMYCW